MIYFKPKLFRGPRHLHVRRFQARRARIARFVAEYRPVQHLWWRFYRSKGPWVLDYHDRYREV